MDINKYIDEIVSFLFQTGIYDINDIDERKRIEDKVQRLKTLASTDETYKDLYFIDKKNIIDTMLNDILVKNAA